MQMVIKVSDTHKSATKKAVVSNEPAESGKTAVISGNYTGYFYNQIERLWKEVIILQEQNSELRASIKGGP